MGPSWKRTSSFHVLHQHSSPGQTEHAVGCRYPILPCSSALFENAWIKGVTTISSVCGRTLYGSFSCFHRASEYPPFPRLSLLSFFFRPTVRSKRDCHLGIFGIINSWRARGVKAACYLRLSGAFAAFPRSTCSLEG